MKTWKHILPIFIITVITIIISQVLFIKMMEREESRCWSELQTTAEATAADIKTKFHDEITKLYLIGRLMLWDDILDAESIGRLHLDEVQPETFFSRIDVLYPDGTIILNGQLQNMQYNGFDALLQKGAFLSGRQIDPITQKPSIYYILPVKQGDTPVAILVGVIYVESLAEVFSVNSYEGQANICIVDASDGSFIMDSWHSELGNFYEMKERTMLEEYADVDPTSTVRNHETGAVAFVSETTGKNIYMYYMPVNLFDWELLIFATEDVIFSGMFYMRELLVLAGIAEAILILLYLAWNRHVVRELERSNAQIQRQKERLEYMSYTDALTAIYNRQKYSETLDDLKQKQVENVGIVYIDLNGLKEINDTQMHEVGDRYIQSAAQILHDTFGETCYRIGGDEFVVLVVGTDVGCFAENLEKMRNRAQEEKISFSVGSVWKESCDAVDLLIKDAEQRMYHEKERYHRKYGGRRSK